MNARGGRLQDINMPPNNDVSDMWLYAWNMNSCAAEADPTLLAKLGLTRRQSCYASTSKRPHRAVVIAVTGCCAAQLYTRPLSVATHRV
jgi:hypothetical protein